MSLSDKESYGDLSDEDTPGPIPNPAVKLVSADGSMWATACKSRSLPRDSFFIFLTLLKAFVIKWFKLDNEGFFYFSILVTF